MTDRSSPSRRKAHNTCTDAQSATGDESLSPAKQFRLTPKQREAISLMPTRNVQIVACAGSGKTEVIARGIAEIIGKGVHPSSVVAFTFTEKAAEELKARIRHFLSSRAAGAASLGDMYAGTIHSFCFETLKELRPGYRAFDVLDDASRVAYLSKPANYYHAVGLVGLQHDKGLNKYRTISSFITAYEIVLNEGISLRRLQKSEPRLADCIKKYLAALHEDRYLDFSTMIHKLVVLLENRKSGAAKELQSRVRHVVVDEYQDINGLQERLIKAMAGRRTRVAVVGDDDQGIYGWRGAVVDYIRDFRRNFPNVKTVKLQDNFRSTRGIVKLTNAYIGQNRDRISKKMIAKFPMGYEAPDIQYKHFDSEEEQARFIIRHIRELVGSDFVDKSGRRFALGLGDFGILVRRNDEATRLLPFLREARIECVVDSGESVFEQEIAQAVLDALDWVFGVSDQSPADVAKAFRLAVRAGGRKLPQQAALVRALKALKGELDRVASKGTRDYLPALGLQGEFHKLLAALDIPGIELTDSEHFYLASVSQAISDYEKVWQRLRYREYKYFRGFVTAWGQQSYAVPGTPVGDITGAVKVMTIHKAKGLEFPVVFVPYLIKKRKQHRRTLVPGRLYDTARYEGNEEDERRVYYVALTRTQKYLFLSGMREDPTVKRPREPATVAAELDQKLLSAPAKLQPQRSGLSERHPDHSFATTFSELCAYGRCGYDYKLRHYYGYNAGVPAFFGYGAQIHNILNLIHTKYRDTKLSNEKIAKLVDEHFYLRYAPGEMASSARRAATKVVQHYVKDNFDEFPKILETEKRFETALGDTLITGQIDLIKEMDPGTTDVKKVAVIDFKSDSSLLYKADSKHQVRLYVDATRKVLGMEPVKATIQDLDKGTERDVDIADAKIGRTMAELGKRIDGIRARRYTPISTPRVCGGCDYCQICKHAAA